MTVATGVADMAARIDFLEHALHETRQRCDLLAYALWGLASTVAPAVWADPFKDEPAIEPGGANLDEVMDARMASWERLGMPEVYDLYRARHLERHHFEGMEPEWLSNADAPHPERKDGDALSPADALLAGARERYAVTRGVAGSLTTHTTKAPV
jgi:hypothetical protein